jgi:threonine/homoserine/homoserine lactone efflux protein
MPPYWLVLKGMMAGLAIAIPVGPVNVMCASRTLAKGRKSGILSGLGAATADCFYGGIAGFSITFIIDFLEREQFWIQVAGGSLLIAIGILYLLRPVAPVTPQPNGESSHNDYVSTLLLTLTNPTTVLSFLAVLAALGMGSSRDFRVGLWLAVGIFSGSMLWWLIVVALVDRMRHRFDGETVARMNRLAGWAIGAFGLVTLFRGLASR